MRPGANGIVKYLREFVLILSVLSILCVTLMSNGIHYYIYEISSSADIGPHLFQSFCRPWNAFIDQKELKIPECQIYKKFW